MASCPITIAAKTAKDGRGSVQIAIALKIATAATGYHATVRGELEIHRSTRRANNLDRNNETATNVAIAANIVASASGAMPDATRVSINAKCMGTTASDAIPRRDNKRVANDPFVPKRHAATTQTKHKLIDSTKNAKLTVPHRKKIACSAYIITDSASAPIAGTLTQGHRNDPPESTAVE